MFPRCVYKIIFGFMVFGSVNCPGLLNKAQNMVGMGTHKVEVYTKQPELKGPQKAFQCPTPEKRQVPLQKATLPNFNPNNDKTIIITTTNRSIFVVFKLSKSVLSRAANLISAKASTEYADSSYIFVDSIYLPNAPTDENDHEIENLLYLLELLSLRYPQESNVVGTTVFGGSWSYGVFKRLTQEIIEALTKSNPEKFEKIIKSIRDKSGGDEADKETGGVGKYYRPILKEFGDEIKNRINGDGVTVNGRNVLAGIGLSRPF